MKPKQESKKQQRTERPRKRGRKKQAAGVDGRMASNISVDAPNALITDRPKSPAEITQILDCLNKHIVFNSLQKQHRKVIIQHMKNYELASNQIVFQQNQPGINFFVISAGVLEVVMNKQRINLLQAGDSFGQLALIHDTPRSATIRTLQHVVMWGLDRRTFRQAVQYVNMQFYEQTKAFISSVPIFKCLRQSEKQALLNSVNILKFSPGSKIVRENEPGDQFYMIKEGIVVCSKDNQEIRHMSRGDFFGEQALLFNTPRTATITAIDVVKCLTVNRLKLGKIFGRNLLKIIYQNSQRMAIEKSPTLQALSNDQITDLVGALQTNSYTKGQIVVPYGNAKSSKMWIVLYGKLQNNIGIQYQRGTCIGDQFLPKQNAGFYDFNIIAKENSDIAEITKQNFQAAIGGQFHNVTFRNQALKALKRVQLFKGLPKQRYYSLLGVLHQQEFAQGDVIVRAFEPGDKFFIIRSGFVDIIKDGVSVRHISTMDYFGQRSILNNEPRTATVVALSNVTCWTLLQADFIRLIDQNIRNQLIKRIQLQDTSVTLQDLVIVRELGKGTFGNVYLTGHREKGHLYAIKTISRTKINAFRIHESVLLQRRILLQLDHHLILKLIKTFKDQQRIYFLMEFIAGQELFDVLRIIGVMSQNDARLYTACLISMVQHLHQRNIIYRDLKPQNIIVDNQGYLKLLDFGTAKFLERGRTYTVIGTPHYMAPEAISGRGYGLQVDQWAIGIMLYEFLCGALPFGEDLEDPFLIYKMVLKRKLVYPPSFDQGCGARLVIEQLLSKNPSMRSGGDINNLKTNNWFAHFDWENFEVRQIEVPYIPQIKDFSEELVSAIQGGVSVEDFVKNEERLQTIPKNLRMKARAPVGNWDSDF